MAAGSIVSACPVVSRTRIVASAGVSGAAARRSTDSFTSAGSSAAAIWASDCGYQLMDRLPGRVRSISASVTSANQGSPVRSYA